MWKRTLFLLLLIFGVSMSSGCMMVSRLQTAGVLPKDGPNNRPNFGRGSDNLPKAGVSNTSREIESSLGIGGR